MTTMRFASHSPPGVSVQHHRGPLTEHIISVPGEEGNLVVQAPTALRVVGKLPKGSCQPWIVADNAGSGGQPCLLAGFGDHGRTTRQQRQEGQYPRIGRARRDRSGTSWPYSPTVQPARHVACLCGWWHLIGLSGRLLMVTGSWPSLLGTGRWGAANTRVYSDAMALA